MTSLHVRRPYHLVASLVCQLVLLLPLTTPMSGQAPGASPASTTVPRLIRFSGAVKDAQGNPRSGAVGITFAFYKDQQGGTPLWLETQNAQVDAQGHYTVNLGATKSEGLPQELFVSGEARWLGAQTQGQAEQPRVLLMSVPYALKALDAETIGGRPASSFLLAPAGSTGSSSNNAPPDGTITGGGTANFVPLFTGATTIGNSKIFQTVGGNVGIGTTTPGALLDVKGKGNVRDTLTLTPKSTHPTLSVKGTAFAVSSTGLITFVSGQSFPGTGTVTSVGSGAGLTGGPITGSGTLSIDNAGVTNAMLQNSSLTVTANGPLNGGGSVALGSSVSLGLAGCASNQILKWNGSAWACAADNNSGGTVTSVGSGLGLTGGPITGNGTLAINTSVVPQLNVANIFTTDQLVNGNLTATGVVTGGSYQIGSNLFGFGSFTNQNAFLGFGGNAATIATSGTAVGVQALASNATGVNNTAVGTKALFSNTSGGFNTATGAAALAANTAGVGNTANGVQALTANTTGSNNTATGQGALGSNSGGADNTASGVTALVSNTTGNFNTAAGASALFGNITGTGNTADGYQALTSSTTGGSNVASGFQALLKNTTGNDNTAAGAFALSSNLTGHDLTCMGFNCNVGADGLSNATAIGSSAEVTQNNSMVLGSINGINGANSDTEVGIGTTAPTNIFTIGKNKGSAIADGWSTYSSRRWKTNIHPLDNALNKVEKLRGVSYDLKDSGKHEIGVIAEEVGKIVPELVTFEANGKDARGVDYSRLTALLIEAVKQQQREIAGLRALAHKQAQKNVLLESRLAQLEQGREGAATSKMALYRSPIMQSPIPNQQNER